VPSAGVACQEAKSPPSCPICMCICFELTVLESSFAAGGEHAAKPREMRTVLFSRVSEPHVFFYRASFYAARRPSPYTLLAAWYSHSKRDVSSPKEKKNPSTMWALNDRANQAQVPLPSPLVRGGLVEY
jgi:hypothetical protein